MKTTSRGCFELALLMFFSGFPRLVPSKRRQRVGYRN